MSTWLTVKFVEARASTKKEEQSSGSLALDAMVTRTTRKNALNSYTQVPSVAPVAQVLHYYYLVNSEPIMKVSSKKVLGSQERQ